MKVWEYLKYQKCNTPINKGVHTIFNSLQFFLSFFHHDLIQYLNDSLLNIEVLLTSYCF